jgi:hypothetical protein
VLCSGSSTFHAKFGAKAQFGSTMLVKYGYGLFQTSPASAVRPPQHELYVTRAGEASNVTIVEAVASTAARPSTDSLSMPP